MFNEKCIFSTEEECNLSFEYVTKCNGIKDKTKCPFWSANKLT